jgi:hypothetical protein
MKKKFDPQLLKEELNRFKLLNEYSFYQEKQETPEYKELILGDTELEEADEPDDTEASADDISSELGLDDTEGGDAEMGDEAPMDEPTGEEPMGEEPPMDEPVDDAVEIDVTSLVDSSEQAKIAADAASQNSEMLLQKLGALEARIASMDKVSDKIEALEKEIIKRNPTSVEKLEMRSLSSYPYSQKLTDYWADKEGAYDVMDTDKKDEYTLTQDDIDADYSDKNIQQSFNPNPEDEYEEEDI